MRFQKYILLPILLLTLTFSVVFPQKKIHHFVFFGFERERIHDSSFVHAKHIVGAQLKYSWKELEPKKNTYNFEHIKNDLTYFSSINKKLFIQLQDVSFDTMNKLVPNYLLEDSVYHGGVNLHYDFLNDEETQYKKGGWVARRWDDEVAKRFHALIAELGKEFDGKIEGINLPETSVDFGMKPTLHPHGFTFQKYRDAIKGNMKALKTAFPHSVTMIYANFMPGEFLPWTDSSYLRDIYSYAKEIKVGVGAPDLLPYKRGQMNNGYSFIKDCDGIIPSGVAVQDGNFNHINPKTKKKITVDEILDFAQNYLKLDYIFWGVQEPYYTRDVLHYLK